MRASTKALLGGIIDYAGTFAPASLSLQAALASYAAARNGRASWLVGRLVCPAGNLRELSTLASPMMSRDIAPFALTVILGGDPSAQAGQLEEVVAFNERPSAAAVIASVEFPPLPASQIRQMMPRVPGAVEAFFEVPVDADLERRVGTIAQVGASAKVRTGGVTSGAFPAPEDLSRFISSCADAGIAFKATAGLHHAIRGSYPLTYDRDSHDSPMYGFLNVCLAAALVQSGVESDEVTDALVVESGEEIQFREDAMVWRQHVLGIADLTATRQRLFRSFGSCAISEPIEELAQLQLL
jgi:hypothetical protein